MDQASGPGCGVRGVVTGCASDPAWLQEGGAKQPAAGRTCAAADRGIQVPRRSDEVEVRVTQCLAQRRRGAPCGGGKARDVAQPRTPEDMTSLLEQCATLAARLPLELYRHARTRMGMIQPVNGALGARQSVQVGD